MDDEERLSRAVARTRVVRLPRRTLATFGVTNVRYYIVTQPIYAEGETQETVIRYGHVTAGRPRIVTPYYLAHVEGFSTEARRYLERLVAEHGAHAPGIYYTYKNEPSGLDIVSEALPEVLARLGREIDEQHDPLAAIIQGEDELWDVSLMKFIYELTSRSFESNVAELNASGLLRMDAGGTPAEARLKIEEMFQQVGRGELEPRELKEELDRWGLFEEYQDRFFAAFTRRLVK